MSRESTPQGARQVYSGWDGFFRLIMENGNCIFKTYFYAFEFHIKPEHANKPHLRLLVEIERTIACSKEVWVQEESVSEEHRRQSWYKMQTQSENQSQHNQ